jgi:hypothetical protein
VAAVAAAVSVVVAADAVSADQRLSIPQQNSSAGHLVRAFRFRPAAVSAPQLSAN